MQMTAQIVSRQACFVLHQKLHLSHLFIFGDEQHHYWHAGCYWSLYHAAKVHRMSEDSTVARYCFATDCPLVSGEYHKPMCLSAIEPFSLMLAIIIAFYNMSTNARVLIQK